MSEIVVVGAGVTGLAFAIGARRHGYKVTVFDLKSRPDLPADVPANVPANAANVIAMNAASTDFLSDLAVLGLLPREHCHPYTHMTVFDGEGTGQVSFDSDDAGLAALGHIVDQRALTSALVTAAETAGVKLQWQTGFDPAQSGRELLVAADGAHSRTREQLGFKKLHYQYDQSATVCVATLASAHGDTAWQWFYEDGPLALLPLADEHRVAVVWSSSVDRAQLGDAQFRDALTAATENHMGDIKEVGARFSFPLMQLQALRYVAPGVALLGDAAHAIHPLAGQGANLGLADAAALVTEIGAARLEGRSPGDITLLRRYERERRLHNHLAGAAMEGFHRLFSNRQPLLGLLRSQGMRFVQTNALARRMAIRVASGRIEPGHL